MLAVMNIYSSSVGKKRQEIALHNRAEFKIASLSLANFLRFAQPILVVFNAL